MNVHMKNTNIKYKLNFKTMKKGLLTVLLASLVLVGCQNYDDQFDDLNAQDSSAISNAAEFYFQAFAQLGNISNVEKNSCNGFLSVSRMLREIQSKSMKGNYWSAWSQFLNSSRLRQD